MNVKAFDQTEAPDYLAEQILARIATLTMRRTRRQLLAWASLTGLSLAGLIYALFLVWQSFSTSGWLQYWQLAWSDQAVIWHYGQEFGWSLLESLPVLTLAAALVVAGLLLWSVSKILDNQQHYGFKKFASI